MSVTINIAGTIIDFPESGTSPDWAPAVVEFAQAVEAALEGVAGAFDVPPQIFNLDSYNPGNNIDITNLNFPTSNVRAANIQYSVYRATTSTNAAESGNIIIVYNSALGTWELSQEYGGQSAGITFNITSAGQVQFSTTAFAGSSHIGQLTYLAKALENS